MRIVCVSDTHGIAPLPTIPPCDLLLHAGDIDDAHLQPEDISGQWRYLEQAFAPWLEAAPARHKIGIAGNHDWTALCDPDVLRNLPWHYLCDETIEIDGVTIYGSPWTLPFFDWAFMLEERELAAKWALIPADCDILLTHGPAYGIGDSVDSGLGGENPDDPHKGSRSLRAAIGKHPTLRLHVFGHIHEGYGQGLLDRPGREPLRCVNAASVDGEYRPGNQPLVIELDARR